MGRDEELFIRIIHEEDLNQVIALDEKVVGRQRREYYEGKFVRALGRVQHIATSLVAEQGGRILGFIMGDLFLGEFGIPESTATIDTIGIDPEMHRKRIASALMQEYCNNVKAAGVNRVITRVEWSDWDLQRFFHSHGFKPSQTISLELNI